MSEMEIDDPSEITETTPLPDQGDVRSPEEVEEERKRESENADDEVEGLHGAFLRFEKDDHLADDWAEYEKRPIVVRAKQIHVPFECVTASGGIVAGNAGDYVVQDIAGYPYACEASVFEATHVPPAWPVRPPGERQRA